MARLRSDDKRHTILHAAMELFAQEGLNVSTARIAKAAGVAEGTIFIYFKTKDILLNQLYLDLKGQLRASLAPISCSTGIKDEIRLAWETYVKWGVAYPDHHHVLALLNMSSRVSAETRAAGNLAFCDVIHLLEQGMEQGILRKQPIDFVGAVMGALGDVTICFVRNAPHEAEATYQNSFETFWKTICE